MNVHILPSLNASLNGLAGIFLLCGWYSVRTHNYLNHKRFMIAAVVTSFFFLVSYLTYHILVPGPTRYQGVGVIRKVYFTILLTHTPLAMVIVPLCIKAVFHAIKGEYDKHIKTTRWLLPLWLYVSITGVIIYLMLYKF